MLSVSERDCLKPSYRHKDSDENTILSVWRMLQKFVSKWYMEPFPTASTYAYIKPLSPLNKLLSSVFKTKMYSSKGFFTSFCYRKARHILKMYSGVFKKSIFWLFPENLHDTQKWPNCLSFIFYRKKKRIYFLSTYFTVLSQFYLFNKYLIITYNFKK